MIGDAEHDVSCILKYLTETRAEENRVHVSKAASWMIRM